MLGTAKIAVVTFALAELAFATILPRIEAVNTSKACRDLAGLITLRLVSNATQVFLPGTAGYQSDVSHWSLAVNDVSACSVEPGNANDVAQILLYLGINRVPFAIKSGGHSPNPGFSSTTGVQISMARFNNVNYNRGAKTVQVGAGLTWDQVYAQLDPQNVTVTGGRVHGVGVGGLTLGGGYSWKANQYGLGIDNLVSCEVALPTGSVVTASATSHPDLFFALRGGGNNFGVVTKFTFKALPQTKIFAGVGQYGDDAAQALINATVNFQTKKDPKAQLILAFGSFNGTQFCSLLLYYDAPTPANGIFDEFLAIPTVPGTFKTTTLTDFLSISTDSGARQAFHTAPIINYSRNLLNVIHNESAYWATQATKYPNSVMSFATEPFLPTLFSTSKGGAYPHTTSNPVTPMNMDFMWQDPSADDFFWNAIKTSTDRIYNAAIAEGQKIKKILYSNYAPSDTPPEQLWGDNVNQLKLIKLIYDPLNTMGLTGGFKIPSF